MSSNQCRTWNIGQRAAMAAAFSATVFCAFVAGTAWAAPAPVEVLKEMPPQGSVRQGHVVYVDDGRCSAGEVKRIIGGNQGTGVARQVKCVKRPRAPAKR